MQNTIRELKKKLKSLFQRLSHNSNSGKKNGFLHSLLILTIRTTFKVTNMGSDVKGNYAKFYQHSNIQILGQK